MCKKINIALKNLSRTSAFGYFDAVSYDLITSSPNRTLSPLDYQEPDSILLTVHYADQEMLVNYVEPGEGYLAIFFEDDAMISKLTHHRFQDGDIVEAPCHIHQYQLKPLGISHDELVELVDRFVDLNANFDGELKTAERFSHKEII